MLPLEAIGVLGFLYLLFMYAVARTYLVKKNISVREKLRESHLVVAIANLMAALSNRLTHAFHRR